MAAHLPVLFQILQPILLPLYPMAMLEKSPIFYYKLMTALVTQYHLFLVIFK